MRWDVGQWGWWVFYFVFLYIVGLLNIILIFVYIILMYRIKK